METPPLHNSQQQNSPAQLLQNAQRAENDGLIRFAQQFYVQIIEQYPGTPEATAAYDALARLVNAANQQGADASAQQPPSQRIPATSSMQMGNPPPQQPHTAQASAAPVQSAYQSSLGPQQQEPATAKNYAPHSFPQQSMTGQRDLGQRDLPMNTAYSPASQPPVNHHPTFTREPNAHHHQNLTTTKGNLNLEPAAGAEINKRPLPFKEPKLRQYTFGNVLALVMIVAGAGIMGIALALIAMSCIAPGLAGSIVGAKSAISVFTTALVIGGAGITITVNGIVARAVFANSRKLHNLALAELQRHGHNRRG